MSHPLLGGIQHLLERDARIEEFKKKIQKFGFSPNDPVVDHIVRKLVDQDLEIEKIVGNMVHVRPVHHGIEHVEIEFTLDDSPKACPHDDPADYVGFTESYRYCRKCGEKL